MRPSLHTRPFHVEELENRLAPAGNVLAKVMGGTLFVTGDDFDNSFYVGGDSSLVRLGGYVDTTVNGSTGPVEFTGVTRVEVTTGDGDDSVYPDFRSSITDVRIETGSGRDFIDPGVIESPNVLIDAGTGKDVIRLNSFFGEDVPSPEVTIRGGDGDDVIRGFAEIFRDLALDTGAGHDFVNLVVAGLASVPASLSIETGDGNDRVEITQNRILGATLSGGLTISTGNGHDLVDVTLLDDTPTTIETGQGRDVVSVFDEQSSKIGPIAPLSVHTGQGDDAIFYSTYARGYSGDVTLDAGAGNDVVHFYLHGGLLASDVTILGGEGNDEITLESGPNAYLITGSLSIDGGDGNHDSLAVVGFDGPPIDDVLFLSGIEILL